MHCSYFNENYTTTLRKNLFQYLMKGVRDSAQPYISILLINFSILFTITFYLLMLKIITILFLLFTFKSIFSNSQTLFLFPYLFWFPSLNWNVVSSRLFINKTNPHAIKRSNGKKNTKIINNKIKKKFKVKTNNL